MIPAPGRPPRRATNLDGFDPARHSVPVDDMVWLDRWAVDRAARLQEEIVDLYGQYNFHMIYQKLHNFCVNDMGGFFLDIIKDRIYTCPTDSLPRRSAQTAIFHVAEAFVRWIAPILSFTADEIWQLMPGDRESVVFTAEWYPLVRLPEGATLSRQDWESVIQVKEAVNKVLEDERAAGRVRASLQAEVTLYATPEIADVLERLEDELRFVTITASARVERCGRDELVGRGVSTPLTDLRVAVKASDFNKCVRCWHHRQDVGHNHEHPELCSRCVENIEGPGETRLYA